MVNEINKPTSNTVENDALRARMESSNRNIERMQQEHQELLREMATLRQTAEELARNSAHHIANNQSNQSNNSAPSTPRVDETFTTNLNNQESDIVVTTSTISNDTTEPTSNSSQNLSPQLDHTDSKEETEDCSEDSAQYLREKIAEIAAMKAQFKRVQHMINTTNMIEEHVARNPLEELPAQTSRTNRVEPTPNEDEDIDSALSDYISNRTAPSSVANTQENVELLMDLLSVFDDFKNDLREQASSLRAERDRLRALKEEILKRRNQ